MSLEQSIDRLSTLIEQLIAQLELGRSAGAAPTKTEEAPKEEKAPKGKSSSGATKTTPESVAPSDSGESTGLDYVKDVAPRFSLLVAKNREEAIKLMRGYKADAKRLEEAVLVDGKHDQTRLAEVLAKVNELLGG